MKIRKAKISDSKKILELLNGDKFLTGNDELKYEPRHVKEFIKGRAIKSYVCEEKNEIIGFANVNIFPIGKYAEFYELIVKKEYRGKNIGKKLFEYIIDQLRNKLDMIFFYTEEKNKILQNLAKKEGFEKGKKFYFYSKELK